VRWRRGGGLPASKLGKASNLDGIFRKKKRLEQQYQNVHIIFLGYLTFLFCEKICSRRLAVTKKPSGHHFMP
jgi:hypothetical protein